jgi:NTE family protein
MKNKHFDINNKKILVLSGGGIKGIAHIGVLKALEEYNIIKNIKIIAGASIGGIIGILYLIGYTPDELFDFIKLMDLHLMRNTNIENVLTKFGIDNGNNLFLIISKMFVAKKIDVNITFQKLYEITSVKIILSTVCVNTREVHYLSYDTHPNMSVIFAMRMTSAVPFIFHPIKYNNKLFVDGGIMDNYPINLFTKKISKVIGIYLEDTSDNDNNINDLETYLFCTIGCVLKGVINALIGKYSDYTIRLVLPKASLLDKNLNENIKRTIFDIGYEKTIEYLKNLTEKYVENNNNKTS